MAEEAFAVHDSWLRYLAKPASYVFFSRKAQFTLLARYLAKLCAFRIIVNLCLVLLQLGICSVFYIFVADHTKQVSNLKFDVLETWVSCKFLLIPLCLSGST